MSGYRTSRSARLAQIANDRHPRTPWFHKTRKNK